MEPNETQQDAQVDPSPTETQETQTQTNPEGQESASSAEETTQTPPSQQQDANKGAAQDALPPKENLYGEFRRKILDEMGPFIQSAVRESMLGVQPGQQAQQGQQPQELKYQGKYSAGELERIIMHPDATEQDKLFATRGLAYIEARQDTLKEIDTRQERQTVQSRQAQAIQGVIKDYPQVFNRSTNSWNFADPLFQKSMQYYNSEPRLQAFGNEGLRIAMDRAYADMARDGQVQIAKKQVKLNSQQKAIDKSQSQALNAGTLSPVKQNGQDTSRAKVWEAYIKNQSDPNLRAAALKPLIPKSWLNQT